MCLHAQDPPWWWRYSQVRDGETVSEKVEKKSSFPNGTCPERRCQFLSVSEQTKLDKTRRMSYSGKVGEVCNQFKQRISKNSAERKQSEMWRPCRTTRYGTIAHATRLHGHVIVAWQFHDSWSKSGFLAHPSLGHISDHSSRESTIHVLV
jgi:hypothetical protein